jgi:hypothetical protein
MQTRTNFPHLAGSPEVWETAGALGAKSLYASETAVRCGKFLGYSAADDRSCRLRKPKFEEHEGR